MVTQAEQATAAAVVAARAVLADAASLARATPAELEAILAGAAELSRIVDGLQVRLAAQIAGRSKGPAEEAMCRRLGHRSAKEAVASAFGIRASAAQALIALAALTAPAVSLTGGEIATRYPPVADALGDGELSLAQAQAIVQQLEPAAPRAELALLAWAENALVEAATDPAFPLVPELLVTQARVYVAMLDPDGVLPTAERQRAMRSARLRQRADGMWELQVISPPEGGSALKAVLDAYSSPRVKVAFRDGPCADRCDGAGVSVGDGAGCDCGRDVDANGQPSADGIGVVDDRTPEQKRHDVLLGLVQAHAASGDAPVAGAEPPTLVFTGTIDAYDAYLHGTDHPDRVLTIEHTGSLVPIETIGRLGCEARVHHAVVNGAGHVLSLGTTERLFNRAQRRALAARDKGCRVPGCGMPAAWCEAHHIVPWELGGPTDIDNGILVCAYHHHEIHAGRLRIERAGAEAGSWRIVPDLRSADRYARTGRTPATQPVAVSSRSIGATIAAATVRDACKRGTTGALAAGAVPSLAVRLPDPPPALAARPPRRRARHRGRTVEQRVRQVVRQVVRGRLRSRLHEAAFDLGPPAHIVMRT